MLLPLIDVFAPIQRAASLITFIVIVGLTCTEAKASSFEIRTIERPRAPAVVRDRDVAASARDSGPPALVDHFLTEGLNDELRTWLLEQEQVDKEIFAPPPGSNALEAASIRSLKQGTGPTQAQVAVLSGASDSPVIRTILANPIPMAVITRAQAYAAPAQPSQCVWPMTCTRYKRAMPRYPAERTTRYALSARLNYFAFAQEIEQAAASFGVDPMFIRAVMHAESAFNPLAKSHAGAQGLMQLMPATARRFGVTNAYAADQSIRGGSQYLAWLMNRFNGNMTLAAAAYNAGEGAVDRHGGVPPYNETVNYVEKVITLWQRYRAESATSARGGIR